MPNLVLDLQWTPIFNWCIVGCDTERSPKRHVLNSGHNWRDLYDHLVTQRIFTLIMNRIFIREPKLEESGYGKDLRMLIIPH